MADRLVAGMLSLNHAKGVTMDPAQLTFMEQLLVHGGAEGMDGNGALRMHLLLRERPEGPAPSPAAAEQDQGQAGVQQPVSIPLGSVSVSACLPDGHHVHE